MATGYQRKRRAVTGAGSVYRTKDGRYRGALLISDPLTGQRKRRVVSGRTEREAQAKLDDLRAVHRPSSTMRTGDLLAHWLPTTRQSIAPSTYRGYASVVGTITEHIGHIPLDRLTATDVETMTRTITASGRAPRTAGLARKVLRVALRYAIRERLVSTNVAKDAKPPKATRYVPRPLTPDEARRLIDGTRDDDDGPLWTMLLTTGLRLGEAAGLSWADVTPDSIRVRQSMSRDWSGRMALGSPKSERSRRRVPLSKDAREALERRRARQAKDRANAGTAWQGAADDLVFTDSIGRPIVVKTAAARLHAATDRLGLPRCRVHDLRHTAASLMIARGVPLTTISRVLGHSTIAITFDTYSTLAEEVEQAAADAMDEALS
jgi:integrase